MKREPARAPKREKSKAVFFDRDGTLIVDPMGEPPRKPEYVKFFPTSIIALKRLQEAGYKLFIISNQPDYMKGKATVAELEAVHNRFHALLVENEIQFSQYYYCFHRAEDTCDCRKPKDYFIKVAEKDFNLDLSKSWMVGNRDTDILCGQNAGVSTILVNGNGGDSVPDYHVSNLWEVSEIIANGG